MEPFVGMKFLHARVINEDNTPREYRVTRVTKDAIYYRPSGLNPVVGGTEYIDPSCFMKRVVKEVLL